MSSSSGTGPGAWERLRSLPGRTPLRVKLITAVLALVIIALAVISFTSRAVFSGYLMRQAEGRLADYYQQIDSLVGGGNLGRYNVLNSSLDQSWLLDSRWQQIQPTGPGGVPIQLSGSPPPQIPTSQAWLTANAGKPVTVSGQSGSSW